MRLRLTWQSADITPVTVLADVIEGEFGKERGKRRAKRVAADATVSKTRFSLTRLHQKCTLRHMRTTLNIDDRLLGQASQLTGVSEKTSLIRLGLEALIALESARRLALLGGTEKNILDIPRRQTPVAQ